MKNLKDNIIVEKQISSKRLQYVLDNIEYYVSKIKTSDKDLIDKIKHTIEDARQMYL